MQLILKLIHIKLEVIHKIILRLCKDIHVYGFLRHVFQCKQINKDIGYKNRKK